MEFSESEIRLLEKARRAQPDSRTRRLILWTSYVILSTGVVAKVAGDFNREEVLIALFVILGFGMVCAYARFQNRALVLINKLAPRADSNESIAVHSSRGI